MQPDERGRLVIEHVQISCNEATGYYDLVVSQQRNSQSSPSQKRYGSLVALVEHLQVEGVLRDYNLPQGSRGSARMHALVDVFADSSTPRRQTLQVRRETTLSSFFS